MIKPDFVLEARESGQRQPQTTRYARMSEHRGRENEREVQNF
jgi:hypothetical protein